MSWEDVSSIKAIEIDKLQSQTSQQRFNWGVGPYVAHRLFNPNLPLSMETGVEVEAGYKIANGLKISGAIRKSILTNFTDNTRVQTLFYPRTFRIGHCTTLKVKVVTFTTSHFRTLKI